MLTLLATIFIIYLIWILVKPVLISYARRKYTERINDFFGQAFGGVSPGTARDESREHRQESAFGGFYRRQKRKIFSKSDGEYIDFVEIEGATTSDQTTSQQSGRTHNPREPQISDAEWEDI